MQDLIDKEALDKLLSLPKTAYDIAGETGKQLLNNPQELKDLYKETLQNVIDYEAAILEESTIGIGHPDELEGAGRIRTAKHDTVITKLKMFNRISRWLGLPDIYRGREDVRHDHALAAFELIYHYCSVH